DGYGQADIANHGNQADSSMSMECSSLPSVLCIKVFAALDSWSLVTAPDNGLVWLTWSILAGAVTNDQLSKAAETLIQGTLGKDEHSTPAHTIDLVTAIGNVGCAISIACGMRVGFVWAFMKANRVARSTKSSTSKPPKPNKRLLKNFAMHFCLRSV
ncbi:hypothetical protein Tco_1566248, partial [Tanacetum coccineum]